MKKIFSTLLLVVSLLFLNREVFAGYGIGMGGVPVGGGIKYYGNHGGGSGNVIMLSPNGNELKTYRKEFECNGKKFAYVSTQEINLSDRELCNELLGELSGDYESDIDNFENEIKKLGFKDLKYFFLCIIIWISSIALTMICDSFKDKNVKKLLFKQFFVINGITMLLVFITLPFSCAIMFFIGLGFMHIIQLCIYDEMISPGKFYPGEGCC